MALKDYLPTLCLSWQFSLCFEEETLVVALVFKEEGDEVQMEQLIGHTTCFFGFFGQSGSVFSSSQALFVVLIIDFSWSFC